MPPSPSSMMVIDRPMALSRAFQLAHDSACGAPTGRSTRHRGGSARPPPGSRPRPTGPGAPSAVTQLRERRGVRARSAPRSSPGRSPSRATCRRRGRPCAKPSRRHHSCRVSVVYRVPRWAQTRGDTDGIPNHHVGAARSKDRTGVLTEPRTRADRRRRPFLRGGHLGHTDRRLDRRRDQEPLRVSPARRRRAADKVRDNCRSSSPAASMKGAM